MSRQNFLQGSFGAGEVSPRLFGRTDLEKYSSGCADLTNFILQPQGGMYRRSGTVFVAPTKNSGTVNTCLIPFLSNDASAFVIEAGNLYFRFFTNSGQLVDGMGAPVEIVTPYTASEVFQLDYAQSANVLFIVHPNHPPMYLQQTSSTTFALTAFNYQDGPYITQNLDPSQTLIHSGFTAYTFVDQTTGASTNRYKGSGTITYAGSTPPFASTDVGRWIRLRQGAVYGCAKITAFTDSSHVTATVFDVYPFGDSQAYPPSGVSANTPYACPDWSLGSWSNTTGWPSAVCFNEGRLFFANTPHEPQGVWASVSAVFNQFSPTNQDTTVVDSNGFAYTLNSSSRNDIQYMVSGRSLMIGTYGADWCVRSSSTATPLTPTNIAFQQQTSYGAAKVKPFLIGTSILYIQRSNRKLREQTYDWSIDGYQSTEISLLSEHLIRQGGGIVQTTYQQEPDSVWWGCRADGVLIGMTYMKDQKIVGFHKHVIGGSGALVKSVCCIPAPGGTQDILWVVVQRTINGSIVNYVEYMDFPYLPESQNDFSTMNFVDCGFKYSGTPITHVTGLSPLQGESVTVVGDGNEQPNQTVSNSGTIDIQSSASLLYIGYNFSSQFTSLPSPVQGDNGTGQGKVKRIDTFFFRVLNSKTFKSGPSYNNLSSAVFLNTQSNMDTSPPLYTGDVKVYSPGSYDLTAQYAVVQDKPYPLNVLAIISQLVVQP